MIVTIGICYLLLLTVNTPNRPALNVRRFSKDRKTQSFKHEIVVVPVGLIASVHQVLRHRLFHLGARAPRSISNRPEIFAPVATLHQIDA
jgi:hypothetical protein